MLKEIEEEVRLTLNNENKVNEYKRNVINNTQGSPVAITISFDMSWSKRASGNRYDSLSRHALAIGVLSKSILVAIVSSKLCRVCSLAESDNEEPPNHCCPKNYDGSSKAMEADAALQLYITLYQHSNKNIVLKAVVTDDDSSMRALLRYKANIRKGRLPEVISQPEWFADPSHRTKVVAKSIFLLSTLPMDSSTCTKVDVIRFKKYFGYMIKENRSKKISEIVFASKAVVEHLFNCHDYCNSNWCRPKKQLEGTDKEKGKELSTSFYRNKYNDAKLYNQIKKPIVHST